MLRRMNTPSSVGVLVSIHAHEDSRAPGSDTRKCGSIFHHKIDRWGHVDEYLRLSTVQEAGG